MNTPQPSGEISLPELPTGSSAYEYVGKTIVYDADEVQAYARAAILADRERSAGAVPEYQKQEHKAAADAINRLLNGSRSFLDAGTAMKALDKFAAPAASPAPAQEAGAVPVAWLVADKFNLLHVSREGISGAFPVYDRPSPLVTKAEPVARVEKHTGSLKDMAIIVWLKPQPPEGTLLYTAPQPSTEAPGGAAEEQLTEESFAAFLELPDGSAEANVRRLEVLPGVMGTEFDEVDAWSLPLIVQAVRAYLAATRLEVPADSTQGEQSHG